MARQSGNWFALGLAVLVPLALVEFVWLAVGARPATFEAIVQEGSMAPTLLGPHYRVTCPECGFAFAIDAMTTDAQATVDCPNCHHAGIGLDTLPTTPGDRVEFVKRGGELALWDVVAFADPGGSGRLLVKRVAGCAGQLVQIKDGDVWCDGQRAAKPLNVLRELAIVVHDATHQNRRGHAASGWRGESGRWSWRNGVWRHDDTPPGDTDADWLSFDYVPPPAVRAADESSAVLDDTPYNAAESRRLSSVADVGLRCELTARGAGHVWLRMQTGLDRWVAKLDLAENSCELSRSGGLPESLSIGTRSESAPAHVEWMLADGQLHLAMDGQELPFSRQLRATTDDTPSLQPLAIGVRGPLTLEIRQLQVVRDVYYTVAPNSPLAEGAHLGGDEILVLGDNSPTSVDSRNWWPAKKVRRSDIGGKLQRVWPRTE